MHYRNQNVPEPTYEMVTKLTLDDVSMEKNPSYSVADAQNSSSDHHYNIINANDDVKDKKDKLMYILHTIDRYIRVCSSRNFMN